MLEPVAFCEAQLNVSVGSSSPVRRSVIRLPSRSAPVKSDDPPLCGPLPPLPFFHVRYTHPDRLLPGPLPVSVTTGDFDDQGVFVVCCRAGRVLTLHISKVFVVRRLSEAQLSRIRLNGGIELGLLPLLSRTP